MKWLIVLTLVCTQLSYAQLFFTRRGEGVPGGWPIIIDFTSDFSTGYLDGQYAWEDYGNQDDFSITAGTGCYGTEGTWNDEALVSAILTGEAALDDDQYVIGTWYVEYSGGSGFGVVARGNVTGTTFYSASYSSDVDNEATRLYKTVSGVSEQLQFVTSGGLNDGDTIMLVVSSDTCYVFVRDSLKITYYNTDISSGGYAGLVATGGGSPDQVIKTWEAGNWP